MQDELIGFLNESHALRKLIEGAGSSVYSQTTQFKDWTVEDVIRHLLFWNKMVCKSLKEGAAFAEYILPLINQMMSLSFPDVERSQFPSLKAHTLLSAWLESVEEVNSVFLSVPPKQRIAWAGPDMSARSAITARLMETWSHGQAIYDLLGVTRSDKDHIKGIATLGINTFAWTYINRKLDVPEHRPKVELISPEGNVWHWDGHAEAGRITGNATEFSQVVTQTRNIADTQLQVVGNTAVFWMENAQCFAGPPVAPPAPNTRFIYPHKQTT